MKENREAKTFHFECYGVLGDFDKLIHAALTDGGPTFIATRIDDKPGVGTTDRDPAQIRQRFMIALGVRKRL